MENEPLTLELLLQQLNSTDPDVRTAAWLAAGEVGAPAVAPLADLMAQSGQSVQQLTKQLAELQSGSAGNQKREKLAALQAELRQPLEVGRAAQRGLWKIVRHTGRPGADNDRHAVVTALLPLLAGERPEAVRREAIWMLSEIAGDEAVRPLHRLLQEPVLREDARLALQRIPGSASLSALKSALEQAPEDFKINIAQSLRARGVEVPGLPCQKLVPSRERADAAAG